MFKYSVLRTYIYNTYNTSIGHSPQVLVHIIYYIICITIIGGRII